MRTAFFTANGLDRDERAAGSHEKGPDRKYPDTKKPLESGFSDDGA